MVNREVLDFLQTEEDSTGPVGIFARSMLLVVRLIECDCDNEEIRHSAQVGYLIDALRDDAEDGATPEPTR